MYTIAHFLLAFVATEAVVQGNAGLSQATRYLVLGFSLFSHQTQLRVETCILSDWPSLSAFWWLDTCSGHWPALVFSMREQNLPGLLSLLGEVNDQCNGGKGSVLKYRTSPPQKKSWNKFQTWTNSKKLWEETLRIASKLPFPWKGIREMEGQTSPKELTGIWYLVFSLFRVLSSLIWLNLDFGGISEFAYDSLCTGVINNDSVFDKNCFIFFSFPGSWSLLLFSRKCQALHRMGLLLQTFSR